MSNINQNNFNNCFNLRLSNSDYWDLFLCTDCGCGLDHESILEACLIIDIDVDVDKCASGDTLCSLVSWSGDSCFESLSVPTTGLTLYDIGLTGIDNGFIKYDCNASTTSSTFIDTYTGSTYTIGSGDTNFCFTKVTGCTYDYSSRFITSANTVGRYVELCGGFYQGFFKLSDRTFYKEMPDNMFVWPISWFTCPPDCPPVSASTGTTGSTCCGQCNSGCGCGDSNPLFIPGSTGACNGCGNSNCQVCNTPLDNGTGGCGPWCANCGGKGDGKGGCCPDPRKAFKCYNDKAPKPWDYQILPTRYEQGWTAEFWMRKNSKVCINTGNTLNALYPNNEGFFYYMGTRAENKFWDVFSGETGYTTTSGYPLPPPLVKKEVLTDNPFLVYQPTGCCCFPGIITETTHERDKNADIINNALGFRIKNDGSVGYRSLGVSGVCSAVTATTISDCKAQCGCGDCNSGCNCQVCNTPLDNGTGGCGPWCKECGEPNSCNCKGSITAITVTEKYITGVTINESYSKKGIVPEDEWIQLAIRFCTYEGYPLDEISNVPRRKGRLDFYVNGYLKYSVEDFDEFIFRDLIEYREKQEGVPFNYSLGGGTQGLLETNTIGGPDPLDENLYMQKFFAGTFFGDISKFRLYECCLDITSIRYRFNELCANYGICPLPLDCFLETEDGSPLSSEDGEDFITWCDE